jgi:hypothetical protein
MRINKKILITVCLLSGAILLASMTFIQQQTPAQPQQPQQQPQQFPKYINLKVLPKKITHEQLGVVMGHWASALGVKCIFCHVRNAETNKFDFPNDSKPEKLMARKMYLMATRINKKFFKGEKDSVGMAALASVNCYTCHRGVAKLDKAAWPKQGGPGGGQGGQRGPGGQSGTQGTTGGSSSPDKKP